MADLYDDARAVETAALRAEIARLQAAKRAALKIADERAKEAVALRATLSWLEDHEPQLVATAREKFVLEQSEMENGSRFSLHTMRSPRDNAHALSRGQSWLLRVLPIVRHRA